MDSGDEKSAADVVMYRRMILLMNYQGLIDAQAIQTAVSSDTIHHA